MKEEILPLGWKKYQKHVLYDYIDCFYQKRLWKDKEIFINILEYSFNSGEFPMGKLWEVDMQISDEYSTFKKSINIKIHSYKKLDFKKMEADSKKLINQICK